MQQTEMGTSSRNMRRRWIIGPAALWVLAASLLLDIGCTRERVDHDYLIRVRDRVGTASEFKQAVAAAVQEAFSGDEDIPSEALNDLRLRVLNQLTDELIIAERAEDLGLKVSEAELEQAVAAIKADYPDDTFKEALLENAVSYDVWKRKLAIRLLVEKVIQKELIDQVQITAEDVAAYNQSHHPQGVPSGEDAEAIHTRIENHLRRQKAEQAYKAWIERLRNDYPVDVNRRELEHLIGARS